MVLIAIARLKEEIGIVRASLLSGDGVFVEVL
jgi:hypothetical protein